MSKRIGTSAIPSSYRLSMTLRPGRQGGHTTTQTTHMATIEESVLPDAQSNMATLEFHHLQALYLLSDMTMYALISGTVRRVRRKRGPNVKALSGGCLRLGFPAKRAK